MNSAQATLPSRNPFRLQETDRSRPTGRTGFVERHHDHRSSHAESGTTFVRRRSRANVWDTHVYNTAILPMQFFTDSGRTSDSASGAQRLMFAVLQDAVACWFRYFDGKSPRKQRLFQETYEWFWTQTPSGLYAFENICEVLKLDPDYMRRGLMRWHPSRHPSQTPPIARRPYVFTRRLAIPHTPVLHAPRLATKKRGKL